MFCFEKVAILTSCNIYFGCCYGIVMWAMPTIFGDDPEPPRYFVCEQPAVEKIKSELPDWRQFVLVVMRALLPFPEAREAVLLAFREASP